LKQETSMEVDHNLFLANGARLLGAGMMVDADAWVHHNVFWESFDTDTTDEQDPHGVRFQRDAAGVFEHNLVGRTDGNGLIVSSSAAPSVRHNIFYQNGAPTTMFSSTMRSRRFWYPTLEAIIAAKRRMTFSPMTAYMEISMRIPCW